MKILGIAVLCALASSSFASYELMLVVDQTRDDIQRYDALTGAYLGSFGSLQLSNPQSVKLVPGKSECLVTDRDFNRISRFNYSTGELIDDGVKNARLGLSTAPNLVTPINIAVVVAPEPASFAILALGAVALLRRKRN